MRTKRLWLRILLTCVLILSLLVGMFGFENNPAQARTVDDSTMPTLAYTNKEGEQVLAPDFTTLTFGKLPPIEEAGWISIPKEFIKQLGYDPSRVWSELANVADVVKLGDIEDALGVGEFSLSAIANITQLDLEQVALSAVGEIVGKQTIGDLVKAIPDLGGLDIGQVKPIADLLGQLGSGGNWNERIGTLVQNEALASLPIGKYLDLSKYGLDSSPGLLNSPLESFKAWGQSSITGVLGDLGLASVPFASFPIPLLNGAIKVGKVDVVWGSAEHGDSKVPPDLYISGAVRDKSDLTTPVPCTADKPCPYIELTDSINPSKANDKVGDAFKSLHGKRWVVGGNNGMKVKEGYGPLKNLNGGWGAAGITVFGADFGKIALTSTDESTGRAKFSLYLRACARIPFVGKSCSPYFIGPIPFPFLNTKEKGFVLVASTAKPKVNVPSKYTDQVAQIQQQYEPQPESNYIADCITGVVGDAVNKAISAVPESMRRYANKTVPLVLAAAKKYGVTDPAQVAYMLSTVQTETMGANVVEGATRNKSAPGSVYYGRGFVQLTSADNYRKASKIVGVDLVKNPERATEPEIAAKILVVGMRDGVFTGRKLSDFIKNGKANFVGARQIVNDSDKQYAMAQDANRYLKAIGGSSIANLKETGSTCSTNIASGAVGQRIFQASQKAYGMDTSAGPGRGNVACAWAVNKVLNQAGIKTIGSNPNLVFSVRDALEAGRGQQISRSQAGPGDLVLALGAGSRQHIGICQNNGCTQVLSNSSSKASFSWKSNTDFGGYYGVPSKIYRVTK